jgi:hypothetical protein
MYVYSESSLVCSVVGMYELVIVLDEEDAAVAGCIWKEIWHPQPITYSINTGNDTIENAIAMTKSVSSL